MNSLNILICEGNTPEESQKFKDLGIATHTESLKESLNYFDKNLYIDVINPCLKLDNNKIASNLKKYDGLIWGGSSLNIYNNTIEIKRQISFMKECLKNIKKILAICWGMQVAVTASGGLVRKGINGSHIGIARDIKLTSEGLNHQFYCNKSRQFNSPAFNFDEVVTVPQGSIHLASNKINNIQSLCFESGISKVWGLQYHPEISYEKMISIINFRKQKLIDERKCFKDENEVKNHIDIIKEEIKVANKDLRMIELKNWLNSIVS
tara:strand:- start:1786 stop:2580 length:795 start_codon:yes stop_codon:yes gene_type:complete